MRRIASLLVACLALPVLSGCAAGLALTGASLLSSIISDGAGKSPHIDFDPNRPLSDTLAGADHEVDPVCRARLDALRRREGPIEPPAPGQCATQPACLGGLRNPMLVIVCADGEAEAPTTADGTARDRPSPAAPWTWNSAEETADATSD